MLIGGQWFEGVGHRQLKGYTPTAEAVELFFDEMFDIELFFTFLSFWSLYQGPGTEGASD